MSATTRRVRPQLRQVRPDCQTGKSDERHQGGAADRGERTLGDTEPDHEQQAKGKVADRHGVREEAAGAEAEEDDERRGAHSRPPVAMRSSSGAVGRRRRRGPNDEPRREQQDREHQQETHTPRWQRPRQRSASRAASGSARPSRAIVGKVVKGRGAGEGSGYCARVGGAREAPAMTEAARTRLRVPVAYTISSAAR